MRLPPFIYLSFAQEDLMSYDDLSKILLLFFTKKKKERCASHPGGSKNVSVT